MVELPNGVAGVIFILLRHIDDLMVIYANLKAVIQVIVERSGIV
jgi:hypothetical protein